MAVGVWWVTSVRTFLLISANMSGFGRPAFDVATEPTTLNRNCAHCAEKKTAVFFSFECQYGTNKLTTLEWTWREFDEESDENKPEEFILTKTGGSHIRVRWSPLCFTAEVCWRDSVSIGSFRTPYSSDQLITESSLLDITGNTHVLAGQTTTLTYKHCRYHEIISLYKWYL